MIAQNFVIATAGHVDHGKSALVKALTGIEPDRLPDEKARGITIDLGFSELNLNSPDGDAIHAAIIDVPGHEGFVRNMIAGVGSIDLALLVVAADDGWMPQTEEHLQILLYLGIDRGVIAITKADLDQSEKMTPLIREQLRNTPFANVPIVSTSVRNGSGLEQLKQNLARELLAGPEQRDVGKPRLFVDRAFTLHGIGTVVTGTLTGGTFRHGETIAVQPRNSQARIRSIQNHGRDAELAAPGMRTAINLPDLAVGAAANAVQRGDVICSSDLEPGSIVDVLLEKSSRLREKEPAGRPLKSGASVFLHHGTSRVPAKVVFLDGNSLNRGEHKIAELRLDSPILALAGDRFVIRDRSEQHTIAGGVVLDASGDRKSFRHPAQRTLLSARAQAPNDLDIYVASEIERRGPLKFSTVHWKSRFSPEEITASLGRLQSQRQIVISGEIAATVQTWQQLRARAVALIDGSHQKNSERSGLDVSELRALLGNQPPEVFAAFLSGLLTDGFVRHGSVIARATHRAALPPDLQPIAARLLLTLRAKPFDPPSRRELISDRTAQQTLSFLIEQGEVVEIGTDALLSQSAFAEMKDKIAKFITAHGPATVSQLRQTLGTSRRIVVPLLELLDRTGFTRRIGDERKLANEPLTASS